VHSYFLETKIPDCIKSRLTRGKILVSIQLSITLFTSHKSQSPYPTDHAVLTKVSTNSS